jgi:ribosome-binding factor A
MKQRRVERLNSLLKEVISEVITRDVKNPDVHPFTTVIKVSISSDMHHAKVFVSVLGSEGQKMQTLHALETAAGFIGVHAAKKVVMRYFPTLTFQLDTSIDEHLRIEAILGKIHQEKLSRFQDDACE